LIAGAFQPAVAYATAVLQTDSELASSRASSADTAQFALITHSNEKDEKPTQPSRQKLEARAPNSSLEPLKQA